MNEHEHNPYSSKRMIYCSDTDEHVTGQGYLSSLHWKMMREKVYEYYSGECQRCHDVLPLNLYVVHHRTYKNIGHENLKDLILYCPKCHAIIHKHKRNSNRRHNGVSLDSLIREMSFEEKDKLFDYACELTDLERDKNDTIGQYRHMITYCRKQIRKLQRAGE